MLTHPTTTLDPSIRIPVTMQQPGRRFHDEDGCALAASDEEAAAAIAAGYAPEKIIRTTLQDPRVWESGAVPGAQQAAAAAASPPGGSPDHGSKPSHPEDRKIAPMGPNRPLFRRKPTKEPDTSKWDDVVRKNGGA
ncbi:MAG: hypothetical protein QM601_07245 [Pseudoxanthomonas sp.]